MNHLYSTSSVINAVLNRYMPGIRGFFQLNIGIPMDIEFHYHITYIIALLAGYKPKTAHIIAYSSQYVDDNNRLIRVINNDGSSYFSCPTQVYCPRYSSAFTSAIYQVYHFIPGDIDRASRARLDGRRHSLLVTANSKAAQTLIKWALATNNPYIIGIASHAFVDTWAHQNFAGTLDEINAMDQSLLSVLMPNIGHADALDKPDLMAKHWLDDRLKAPLINNSKRFVDAAVTMLKYYCASSKLMTRYEVNKRARFIKDWLLQVAEFSMRFVKNDKYPISDQQLQYRTNLYHHLSLKLSGNTIPKYNSQHWFRQAIRKRYFCYPLGGFVWLHSSDYRQCDWYNFQQAAKVVKRFALRSMDQC